MPEDQRWPAFENALLQFSQTMPQEVASMKDRDIRPMSALERMYYGSGAASFTMPNGNILYNKDAAQAAGMRPEDVMAHELTHVKQTNQRGLLGSLAAMLTQLQGYGDRPDEKEAFDAEAAQSRKRPRGDIDLPAEKTK